MGSWSDGNSWVAGNSWQTGNSWQSGNAWEAVASDSPLVLQDGLVADWRFDDGAGQIVTDYAGGHHLRLGSTAGVDANDPTWVSGGLSFAGDTADHYTTTDGGGGDWEFPSPDFHVDLVLKGETAGAGTDFVVVFGTTNTGAADDDLCPLLVLREGLTENIRVRIGTGAGSTLSNVTSDGPFDDGWHYVAIDYDGNDLTIRMDGATVLTQTLSITPNVISAATQFGIWHDLNALPADMIMGYCAVYDHQFSADERTAQASALAAIMAGRGVALP